jgi:serine protease AprX
MLGWGQAAQDLRQLAGGELAASTRAVAELGETTGHLVTLAKALRPFALGARGHADGPPTNPGEEAPNMQTGLLQPTITAAPGAERVTSRRRQNVALAVLAVAAVVASGLAVRRLTGDTDPPMSMGEVAVAIGADDAWSAGLSGSGIAIAVLDSGVDEVPGLAGRVDRTGPAVDPVGHGTHLAGIAAGGGGGVIGVAPGATILDRPIVGVDGLPSESRLVQALEALARRSERGELIVALVAADLAPSAAIDRALTAVADAGVFVVAAIGNDGVDAVTGGVASHPAVMGVGGVLPSGAGWRVAEWSSRTVPDLVAPGDSIVSYRAPGSSADVAHPEGHVGESWQRGTGSSQAAAVVAGAAALLWEANPDVPSATLRAVLGSTARQLVGDSVLAQGAGLLDVAEALRAMGTSLPAWTGNSWTGNSWTGNSWTGNSWTGNSWTGNSWTGNSWTGNSWT